MGPRRLVSLFVWVFAALLLTIGWWRKRRQARATLARWEREESESTVALDVIDVAPVQPPDTTLT